MYTMYSYQQGMKVEQLFIGIQGLGRRGGDDEVETNIDRIFFDSVN